MYTHAYYDCIQFQIWCEIVTYIYIISSTPTPLALRFGTWISTLSWFSELPVRPRNFKFVSDATGLRSLIMLALRYNQLRSLSEANGLKSLIMLCPRCNLLSLVSKANGLMSWILLYPRNNPSRLVSDANGFILRIWLSDKLSEMRLRPSSRPERSLIAFPTKFSSVSRWTSWVSLDHTSPHKIRTIYTTMVFHP